MKQKNIERKELQNEKRVVFFNGTSWYHRTKELLDDMTTKYGKREDLLHRKRQRKATGNMKNVIKTGRESYRLRI